MRVSIFDIVKVAKNRIVPAAFQKTLHFPKDESKCYGMRVAIFDIVKVTKSRICPGRFYYPSGIFL